MRIWIVLHIFVPYTTKYKELMSQLMNLAKINHNSPGLIPEGPIAQTTGENPYIISLKKENEELESLIKILDHHDAEVQRIKNLFK